MKRFELTRVVVKKDITHELEVGKTYCAIRDNSEFAPNALKFQPYGIITYPIDAKTLHDMIEEANISGDPIPLCDATYFNWVIYDNVECVELNIVKEV